jgi:replicative superfamily II helicase
MIVTTPEKWDVITRKSSDMSLSMLVKLIIIDEVHLLNDDRGSVIEALVARTLRQVSLFKGAPSPFPFDVERVLMLNDGKN